MSRLTISTVGVVLAVSTVQLTLFTSAYSQELKMKNDKSQTESQNVSDVQIQVIYDNRAESDEFESAWGFSCLVTADGHKLLFDTGGDGEILLRNMKKFAIDSKSITKVVLSHEHWDHVGGLDEFLAMNDSVEVYVLKCFPDEIKKTVTSAGAIPVEVVDSREIVPGVFTTGEIEGHINEQALVVRTDDGLIVITGCAHPGIVKIVRTARELLSEKVLFVMGGFHLHQDSDSKVRAIISELKGLGVQYAAPCHCSGDNAIELFRQEMGSRFISVKAGITIKLEDLGLK